MKKNISDILIVIKKKINYLIVYFYSFLKHLTSGVKVTIQSFKYHISS